MSFKQMIDRFQLEQEMFQCWSVVEDLDLLLAQCEKIEDAEVADHIMNIVLGIRVVSEMRFQKMFSTFEDLVHDGQIS
jgi:hypothetical protein